jgi:hypothetical protein
LKKRRRDEMKKALECGAGGFIGGHLVKNDVLLYCENAISPACKIG